MSLNHNDDDKRVENICNMDVTDVGLEEEVDLSCSNKRLQSIPLDVASSPKRMKLCDILNTTNSLNGCYVHSMIKRDKENTSVSLYSRAPPKSTAQEMFFERMAYDLCTLLNPRLPLEELDNVILSVYETKALFEGLFPESEAVYVHHEIIDSINRSQMMEAALKIRRLNGAIGNEVDREEHVRRRCEICRRIQGNVPISGTNPLLKLYFRYISMNKDGEIISLPHAGEGSADSVSSIKYFQYMN